ncbi:hypothetical protein CR513_57079, partial [Mucuna pruriens]
MAKRLFKVTTKLKLLTIMVKALSSRDSNQILLEEKLKNGFYTFNEIHIQTSSFSTSIFNEYMSFHVCNIHSKFYNQVFTTCNDNSSSIFLITWNSKLGHTNSKIIELMFQSDGGKEYYPITEYLHSCGIIHKFPCLYTQPKWDYRKKTLTHY